MHTSLKPCQNINDLGPAPDFACLKLLKSAWRKKADLLKLALPKDVPQKAASLSKLTPEKEALAMVQLTRARVSWTWAPGREEMSRLPEMRTPS